MVIWGSAFHCDPQLLSANLGGSKPQGVLPHFKLPPDILSIVGPTFSRLVNPLKTRRQKPDANEREA
jgi:hypothetical protein